MRRQNVFLSVTGLFEGKMYSAAYMCADDAQFIIIRRRAFAAGGGEKGATKQLERLWRRLGPLAKA